MTLTETVEHVVVGAGPAGLRAAQVLAEAGREVIVLERHDVIGPKTCGGGLSLKAVRELRELGLPDETGCTMCAHAAFEPSAPPVPLDPDAAVIRTVARQVLGQLQASWTGCAGADLRTGVTVSGIDRAAHTLSTGGRRIRYRHLIGADGSTSTVRRALALPSPRAFFAAEFNVRGLHLPRLEVIFDGTALASGYFWIFPHTDYTSIGAGGPKHQVPPSLIRPYLERRMSALGIEPGDTPYEGATIEVSHHGFDFADGIHLVGDAAGVASGLTAEGIYAALVTGEEVARRILEPDYPSRKTRAWLRTKKAHDIAGRLWLRKGPRTLSLAALPALCAVPATRRWVSTFFLGG